MAEEDNSLSLPPPSNASGELGRASLDAKAAEANTSGDMGRDSLARTDANASGGMGRASIENKDANASGELGAASRDARGLNGPENADPNFIAPNSPRITGLSAPSSSTSSPATNRVYSRFPDSSAGSAFDAAGAKRDALFNGIIANAENRLSGPGLQPAPSLDAFDRGATVARVSGTGSGGSGGSSGGSGHADGLQGGSSSPMRPAPGSPLPAAASAVARGAAPRSIGMQTGDGTGPQMAITRGASRGSTAREIGVAVGAAPGSSLPGPAVSVQRGAVPRAIGVMAEGSGPARISASRGGASPRALRFFSGGMTASRFFSIN